VGDERLLLFWLPRAEKLCLTVHRFRSLCGDKLKDATHLLPERIALLPDKDNTRMRLPLLLILGVQSKEITDVKRAEYPALGGRLSQVVLVWPLDHPRFEGG
jgi:hypothetical protein